MTFTITDFLISLPITAIIIFAIKLVYKMAGISATPMGCLIGCLIMFWFVLCAIGGCSERKRTQSESHLAHIKLVTTGAIVKIPKSELVGADTIYREKKHVYKNDTGRDLVEYMVKYTTNGQDANHEIIGLRFVPTNISIGMMMIKTTICLLYLHHLQQLLPEADMGEVTSWISIIYIFPIMPRMFPIMLSYPPNKLYYVL